VGGGWEWRARSGPPRARFRRSRWEPCVAQRSPGVGDDRRGCSWLCWRWSMAASPSGMEEEDGSRLSAMRGVGVLRLHDYNDMALRRRRCEASWMVCPIFGSMGDVRRYRRKSCPTLVEQVATAPAGVVPLLVGTAEVCRRLPRSLGVGCCLRAKASIRSRFGTMSASSMLYLCWDHHAWRHGSEVLCCIPPVFAVVQGWSSGALCTPWLASPRWCLLGTDQVPPLIFFWWCVDKDGSFGGVVLLRCPASVETQPFCLV
jgi:hypothetical protein